MRKINARQIDMSNYRVENKGNINYCGSAVTSYALYQYDASRNAYVHTSNGFAPGYNASDRMCVKHFLAVN